MPDPHLTGRSIDPWLFVGGPVLSMIAGYVNVVLLMIFAMPVSHVTGSLAHLALDAALHDVSHLRMAMSVALAFLIGAAFTGFWTEGQLFQHRWRYGWIFIAQGLAFCLAAHWIAGGSWLAVPAAALGCGMQNALATSYRGLNLRTTHMTGIVTDIGVLLGLRARGQKIQSWRLTLLSLIFVGYLIGTYGGVLVGRIGQTTALLLPAGACLLGGVSYLVLVPRMLREP